MPECLDEAAVTYGIESRWWKELIIGVAAEGKKDGGAPSNI
jgi:hypothetical protein